MKVRVGYGPSLGAAADAGAFADLVDGLEDLGFDSLWLSERATGPGVDPLVGLSVAAGRTQRLKLGTSVQVLPGRNPLLLARAWASLDVLSAGRALPAFGLGVADPAEQQAFGVARGERGARFDEAVQLVRRFWTEPTVTHHGPHFDYDAVGLRTRPLQGALDIWFGGRAPGELRRVGRLADGWLASFTTPALAATGREAVTEAATAAGRAIDPEHWGVLISYARHALPEAVERFVARALPGVDPAEVVPVGLDALRSRLDEFVAQGFSKFVAVPVEPVTDWAGELDEVATVVLDRQT